MRKSVFLYCLFLLLVVSTAACGPEAATPVRTAPTSAPVTSGDWVIAEARVVPVRRAALSYKIGGTVAQVPVAVGEHVQAGQILAQLETRELELQLAQAEGNLGAAQSKLDQIERGAVPAERTAARVQLDSAQAAYENLIRPNDQELVALKSEVDKAQSALGQAQAAYDRIGGDSNPEATMSMERLRLQVAWQDVQRTVALYNLKIKPPSAQVQQALAAIESAKSQIAKLDATTEELAAAQGTLRAAQAARDLAAEQLGNAQLTAPFAGVITAVDLRAGEYTAPGVPVVRLGDVSAWEIETTDLAETGAARVVEGALATATFDALPSLELQGKVTRIKLFGENRQGDIVYTVTITPDRHEDRLRWNMTASVRIAKN